MVPSLIGWGKFKAKWLVRSLIGKVKSYPYWVESSSVKPIYPTLKIEELQWKRQKGKFFSNLNKLKTLTDKKVFRTNSANTGYNSCHLKHVWRCNFELHHLKVKLSNTRSEEKVSSLPLIMFNGDIKVDLR